MPNQFFSPEGDLEYYFADEYWLVDQYVGDTLYVWGDNVFGAVGDNATVADRSTPRQEFTGSTNWKQAVAGTSHTLAIKTDGTLYAWGLGSTGEVGDNALQARSTPRQISSGSGIGINGWKYIDAGFSLSAAIRNDGTLWTWGLNSYGQLGTNDRVLRSFPIQEATLSTNWKQVSCGTYHMAAIKTDGTLWTWGRNDSGQLGDNNSEGGLSAGTNARSTPRQISAGANGITGWKQVTAGFVNTAAIREDGTLWVWGNNTSGQVGDNTFSNRSTPRQISAGATRVTGWKQVACSSTTTHTVRQDGTLWSWGRNDAAQVGDNTTVSARATPIQEFTASTNWKYVSSKRFTVSAVKTNGTLWGWGQNSQGEIGDNTTAARSTPRQEFSSATNWKQSTTGNFHTTGIKIGAELD